MSARIFNFCFCLANIYHSARGGFLLQKNILKKLKKFIKSVDKYKNVCYTIITVRGTPLRKKERGITMKRFEMKIKDWFYKKTSDVAKSYNTFIDFARNEDGMCKVEDGYITVVVEEVISESEKAIQVRLASGESVGSYKGWKTWVPKSVICE